MILLKYKFFFFYISTFKMTDCLSSYFLSIFKMIWIFLIIKLKSSPLNSFNLPQFSRQQIKGKCSTKKAHGGRWVIFGYHDCIYWYIINRGIKQWVINILSFEVLPQSGQFNLRICLAVSERNKLISDHFN